MRAIYWLRQDLRVHDNETLFELTKKTESCLIVYSSHLTLRDAGVFRRNFITEALHDLSRKLEKHGLRIHLTSEPFLEYLASAIKSQSFDALYFSRDHAWDERKEEDSIIHFCNTKSIKVYAFEQSTLLKERELPFGLDQMPFIFSDFRKKIEPHRRPANVIPSPQHWPRPIEGKTEKFPTITSRHPYFVGGETFALERLNHYLWETHSIQHYKDTRNNMIEFDDSSKLSPWLNTGCLSARYLMSEVERYETEVIKNESTYWMYFELLWREYLKFFSQKYGSRIFFKDGLRPGSSANKNDLGLFKLWCEGKTPEPFINANMNELNQTGWMSNRGRQNVASYLIHDLGINWTWGARYFEQKLIDYDPDLNWGNWLYLSGRGSDPRARKFNISRQAQTYDPRGEYQKRWT